MCCHIGLNTALDQLADRDPTPRLAWTLSCMPLSACEALGMWLLTGILTRFPDLKIVFVEPGLAWVAGYVAFLDDMVLRQGYEFPVLDGELPSFYYHRNLAMTFIDEPDPVRNLRHVLGAQNLIWSSDYPHPVSTWPKSLTVIEETFEGIPEVERDLMVEGNAGSDLEPVAAGTRRTGRTRGARPVPLVLRQQLTVQGLWLFAWSGSVGPGLFCASVEMVAPRSGPGAVLSRSFNTVFPNVPWVAVSRGVRNRRRSPSDPRSAGGFRGAGGHGRRRQARGRHGRRRVARTGRRRGRERRSGRLGSRVRTGVGVRAGRSADAADGTGDPDAQGTDADHGGRDHDLAGTKELRHRGLSPVCGGAPGSNVVGAVREIS